MIVDDVGCAIVGLTDFEDLRLWIYIYHIGSTYGSLKGVTRGEQYGPIGILTGRTLAEVTLS